MSDRFSIWFPMLLLAVLAALSFWLDQFVKRPEAGPNPALRHDPDYIVHGLSAQQLAPDGTVKHTLYAAKMVHYPDDDTTHLTAPVFVSYATPKAPVKVTAKKGLLSSEGENIYFRNDVHVTRAPYDDHSELVLDTSYLHVIPDENFAETDKPVTITDANTVVHAIGLELNSETRVLKLRSEVKGTYHEPDEPGNARRTRP
jgi:lipopolysaccharide export system protein LptC